MPTLPVGDQFRDATKMMLDLVPRGAAGLDGALDGGQKVLPAGIAERLLQIPSKPELHLCRIDVLDNGPMLRENDMTKTKASVPMSDCSGCNAPFLLVSRSVYRELMDAEMRERGRSEGGISTGSEMRKVLMKYIPHETDILPNPVRVAVKASDDDFQVEVVQSRRRP